MNLKLILQLWWQTAARHWRREAWQTILLVLTLSLGVAVFIAVRAANRAAVGGFSSFVEVITGDQDWIVQAPVGRLSVEDLRAMRRALGSEPVHLIPVAEARGILLRSPEDDPMRSPSVRVVGLDLLGIQNVPTVNESDQRVLFDDTTEEITTVDLIRERDRIYPSPALGLPAGEEVTLLYNDEAHRLTVRRPLPKSRDDEISVPEDLIIMDLPALQQLAGRLSEVDRVELIVEPGPASSERAARARELLVAAADGRWEVVSPDNNRETGRTMTQAFRLNLTVLSLIAILVGLYLVLQALEAAVVRRREEIAVLRALGVEAGTIRNLWLMEAAILGLIGSVVGVVLGALGAQGAVVAVTQTINTLYQATSAASAPVTPGDAIAAVVLGTVTSLVAGFWPARDAARTPPARVLRRGIASGGRKASRHAWWGLPLMLLGAWLYQLPPYTFEGGVRFPLAGYLAAIIWLIGGGLLTGAILPLTARIGLWLLGRWVTFKAGLSRLRHPSGRHRLTVAGLVVATAMAAAMTIMIGSFETTMRSWIANTLQGDLYAISAASRNASADASIPESTWIDLAGDPDIAMLFPVSFQRVEVNGLDTLLIGEPPENPTREYIWLRAPPDGIALAASATVEPVYVSESFSERFGLGMNGSFDIPTPKGPRRAIIVGIFAEYGNERGSIVADRSAVVNWFDDNAAMRLTAIVNEGVEPREVADRWQKAYPGLGVRTNASLRAEVLRIFRQTFSITYALQIIGLGVAMIGLALGLASLVLEIRRDLTTLRALGMSRGEIAATTTIEGLGMAFAAVVGGLTLSLLLGNLLIYVINKQSFGWTLNFALPWAFLAGIGIAVLATGTLTAWLVGRWGANLPADREE